MPVAPLATPPLAGKTLASAGLHQMPGAFLSSIDRDGKPLPAVTKDEVLREGDILWFAGGCGAHDELASGLVVWPRPGMPIWDPAVFNKLCYATNPFIHRPPPCPSALPIPPPAADVNSVRFIRNTPGLKPLVDDKVCWAGRVAVPCRYAQPAVLLLLVGALAAIGRHGWCTHCMLEPHVSPSAPLQASKLEKTRYIDRRLVQVVVAGSSPLVGEPALALASLLAGCCRLLLPNLLPAVLAGRLVAKHHYQLRCTPACTVTLPQTHRACLHCTRPPQARRCVSCSSATSSTALWWPSAARASAFRWGEGRVGVDRAGRVGRQLGAACERCNSGPCFHRR